MHLRCYQSSTFVNNAYRVWLKALKGTTCLFASLDFSLRIRIAKHRLWLTFPIKPTEVSLLPAIYYFPCSNQSYQVITSSPHLPILPILVNALNETGDVYAFVRQVRDQYHELVSPSQTFWEHCWLIMVVTSVFCAMRPPSAVAYLVQYRMVVIGLLW